MKPALPQPSEEAGLGPKRAPRQVQMSGEDGLHQSSRNLQFAIGLELHDRLSNLSLAELQGER